VGHVEGGPADTLAVAGAAVGAEAAAVCGAGVFALSVETAADAGTTAGADGAGTTVGAIGNPVGGTRARINAGLIPTGSALNDHED
jgi:hypothetical protein